MKVRRGFRSLFQKYRPVHPRSGSRIGAPRHDPGAGQPHRHRDSEQERLATPISANTNRITTGKSDGWSLIYCKGPEGEQLEFVQALGPVKKTFEEALSARRRMLAAN